MGEHSRMPPQGGTVWTRFIMLSGVRGKKKKKKKNKQKKNNLDSTDKRREIIANLDKRAVLTLYFV